VPLGTPFSDLIDFCGGFTEQPERLVAGGPMMGRAQWDLEAPVTKGTNALLALSAKQTAHYAKTPSCIRCGRCVAACPIRLLPCELYKYARKGDMEESEKLGALACVECGCCSYVCPAQIPLVQYIGVAKASIAQAKRVRAMAQAASKPKA
jgi:electron transport complex protein RnfC